MNVSLSINCKFSTYNDVPNNFRLYLKFYVYYISCQLSSVYLLCQHCVSHATCICFMLMSLFRCLVPKIIILKIPNPKLQRLVLNIYIFFLKQPKVFGRRKPLCEAIVIIKTTLVEVNATRINRFSSSIKFLGRLISLNWLCDRSYGTFTCYT